MSDIPPLEIWSNQAVTTEHGGLKNHLPDLRGGFFLWAEALSFHFLASTENRLIQYGVRNGADLHSWLRGDVHPLGARRYPTSLSGRMK